MDNSASTTDKPFGHGSIESLGRPISNVEIYILDHDLQLSPTGAKGEIYIGGLILARGYLNQPELTAAHFVPNPFSSAPGQRMYRSGDLGRHLLTGEIQYLGRYDQQVKIRGHRVELAEVETAIRLFAPVSQATVSVHSSDSENRELVAYVVWRKGLPHSKIALHAWLAERLPEYMQPRHLIEMEALPLSPHGKLDRQRLPSPITGSTQLSTNFDQPCTATEALIVRIFENILEHPISVNDNFFTAGGHSLLAIRALDRLQKAGAAINLSDIFQYPSARELATRYNNTAHEPKWETLLPIQPRGARRPLFCIHGNISDLIENLPEDQPVYWLHHGREDGLITYQTVAQIAAIHIAEIRTVQEHGPYNLAGFGFGGILAIEVARQLHREGERHTLLALFSCFHAMFFERGASTIEFGWIHRQWGQPHYFKEILQLRNGTLLQRISWHIIRLQYNLRHYSSLTSSYLRYVFYASRSKHLPADLVGYHYSRLFNKAIQSFPCCNISGDVHIFSVADNSGYYPPYTKFWPGTVDGKIMTHIIDSPTRVSTALSKPCAEDVARILRLILNTEFSKDCQEI